MPASEPGRKKRFWEVDPTLFQTRKRGRRERLVEGFLTRLRSLGKSLAFLGLFTYPLTMTLIGVIFGGLAYWGTLAASVLLFVLMLTKFGYARNFDNRDIKLGRSIVGTSLGFLVAATFYLGLSTLKLWIIPIIFGLLLFGIMYLLTREG